MRAVLDAFPGARIESVRETVAPPAEPMPDADELPEEDDASMKNLGQMMKQAQEMQARMAEMQAKLAEVEMNGSAGGGMVQVTLNGKGEMRRVKIDKVADGGRRGEVLEDLIVAATNDAKAHVEAYLQQEMSKLTGGLQLPPGMKLPF